MHSSRYLPLRPVACTALALLLSACGGGGGGSSTSNGNSSPDATASTLGSNAPTPIDLSPQNETLAGSMPIPPSAPAGVFISEVANTYDNDPVSWFEIYNNTNASIDLSSYLLRAPALHLSSNQKVSAATFALPKRILPANGYIVIAARTHSDLLDTSSSIYIANAQNQVPHWQGSSGFIELLSGGATVDFVSFGSNSTQPTTSSAWNSGNAPPITSTVNHYSTAIVRPFSNFRQTRSASDWIAVNFATPGGINDVPAGVTDSDGDGIPDSAKIAGGSYAGLDLYAMGARRGQRDLFIQVDYLASQDSAVKPSAAALDKVSQAFLKQNIAVHFDVGNLFSPSVSAAQHNLSGGSHLRPHATCTQLKTASHLTAGCNSLYAVKSAYFDIRRQPVFRYLLLANSQQPSGTAGSSGAAEFSGDDFLVTLGGWSLSAGSVRLMNYQAATIMHELGHTLGLRHGGEDDIPNKPNYYSVMNYFYQMTGLPDPRGQGVTQRYYYWLTHYQNEPINGYSAGTPFPESQLEDGPHSLNFKIDYSDGSGASLDESVLWEQQLIGRGKALGYFSDWNGNGIADLTPIKIDINRSGGFSVLKDHSDWGNLLLKSSRNRMSYHNGVSAPGACAALTAGLPFSP